MTEEQIKTLEDAVWLIGKLADSLGIDLDDLPDDYNNSYEELWEIINNAN